MLAIETICAEIAFMLMELNRPDSIVYFLSSSSCAA